MNSVLTYHDIPSDRFCGVAKKKFKLNKFFLTLKLTSNFFKVNMLSAFFYRLSFFLCYSANQYIIMIYANLLLFMDTLDSYVNVIEDNNVCKVSNSYNQELKFVCSICYYPIVKNYYKILLNRADRRYTFLESDNIKYYSLSYKFFDDQHRNKKYYRKVFNLYSSSYCNYSKIKLQLGLKTGKYTLEGYNYKTYVGVVTYKYRLYSRIDVTLLYQNFNKLIFNKNKNYLMGLMCKKVVSYFSNINVGEQNIYVSRVSYLKDIESLISNFITTFYYYMGRNNSYIDTYSKLTNSRKINNLHDKLIYSIYTVNVLVVFFQKFCLKIGNKEKYFSLINILFGANDYELSEKTVFTADYLHHILSLEIKSGLELMYFYNYCKDLFSNNNSMPSKYKLESLHNDNYFLKTFLKNLDKMFNSYVNNGMNENVDKFGRGSYSRSIMDSYDSFNNYSNNTILDCDNLNTVETDLSIFWRFSKLAIKYLRYEIVGNWGDLVNSFQMHSGVSTFMSRSVMFYFKSILFNWPALIVRPRVFNWGGILICKIVKKKKRCIINFYAEKKKKSLLVYLNQKIQVDVLLNTLVESMFYGIRKVIDRRVYGRYMGFRGVKSYTKCIGIHLYTPIKALTNYTTYEPRYVATVGIKYIDKTINDRFYWPRFFLPLFYTESHYSSFILNSLQNMSPLPNDKFLITSFSKQNYIFGFKFIEFTKLLIHHWTLGFIAGILGVKFKKKYLNIFFKISNLAGRIIGRNIASRFISIYSIITTSALYDFLVIGTSLTTLVKLNRLRKKKRSILRKTKKIMRTSKIGRLWYLK